MTLWLWLNLGLGALFVLVIVGVPLWLVISRPDRATRPADLPGWRQAREARVRHAAATWHRQVRVRTPQRPASDAG
jgi:hypothetical protein